MTRSDLVRALAERRGLSHRVARQAVDSVLAGIVDSLCEGKRVEAARRLGIDRTTLYRLMRRHGIE